MKLSSGETTWANLIATDKAELAKIIDAWPIIDEVSAVEHVCSLGIFIDRTTWIKQPA